MFGANINSSLQPYGSSNLNGVKSDGLWNPSNTGNGTSGHAMCVVGYDNYKYGGSFRVVNSWGKDYGDNGFLWIRYNDFKKYAKEIYLFQLDNIDFDSNILCNSIDGINNMPFELDLNEEFGNGNSDILFLNTLQSEEFWRTKIQKKFQDI